MSRFVPYLADEAIERDAASLIGEYERARGVTIEPPIPIEDLVEKHLKLRIEFDDMHARHDLPRPESGKTHIRGAIYGDGSIFIDESLDPEENPEKEARYRFTLAHEAGHFRYHEDLLAEEVLIVAAESETGQPGHVPGRGVEAPACGRSEPDQEATAGSLTVGLSVTRASVSTLMYRRATAHSSLVSSSSP
jgi:hypothetical protein